MCVKMHTLQHHKKNHNFGRDNATQTQKKKKKNVSNFHKKTL